MPVLPDIPAAEAIIVQQTNVFRAENKLPAVQSEPALAKAARIYAQFLSATPVFSHEADGRRPVDRIKAAGYQACSSAENLALLGHPNGFETLDLATRMVEGWKNSPGHRKNMLLEHVIETGVAIFKSRREEKYFAVQLFGRPASMQYAFAVENTAGRAVTYTLGADETKIEPRMVVRHSTCLPTVVTFQLKGGGLLSKAVTARYEAKGGQVFRLTAAKGGDVVVEVSAK